jgi:hypothetical protein
VVTDPLPLETLGAESNVDVVDCSLSEVVESADWVEVKELGGVVAETVALPRTTATTPPLTTAVPAVTAVATRTRRRARSLIVMALCRSEVFMP